MRAFGIEFANEIVEACLLLQAVHAGRAGCFLFQGEMHPFVASVLLGMAGLDALDGDAGAEPPDRQLREIVEAVRACKRQAVIGADGIRQTALLEQPDEGLERARFLGRLEGFAHQNEARGLIGDGQRVTVFPVAELELTLEVGAPQGIGLDWLRQRRAVGLVAPCPGADDQTVAVGPGRCARACSGNQTIVA